MPSQAERAYRSAFVLWHARNEASLPYWPLERIREIQNRRVRAMTRHAYDTVPFYRAAMDEIGLRPEEFRTAEDLRKLPLLTSEEIARSPDRFLSHRFANGPTLSLESSGTQGLRKPVRYDDDALLLALAHGHRQRVVIARFVGRTLGYREMTIERLDGTGYKLRKFYENHSMVPKQLDYARTFLSPAETTEDTIAAINRFAPQVIRGYGSHLGSIFRQAHGKQLALVKPKVVLYGGDSMSEADKRLIEDEIRVPVLSSYQAVEALRIAFQCERSAGFHVNLDQIALHVVDDQGDPVPNGIPGQVVISNLTNRATVLLNYQLGDMGTFTEEPCACGRTLPILTSIQGRANDCVYLPDGRIIHSLVLMPPLQSVKGTVRLQIVQTEPAHFEIRAVCASGVDWAHARLELEKRAHGVMGNAISIDVSRVDASAPDSGGKVRAVISHCQT
ncbi:MAG: hypothetical protein M1570_06875 [Chloroflexi bacterium]|nr:hypothetical protein [Chloroflexota bacterium]